MQSPRHPRFPLLDGVRALSALAVLLLHAALFTAVFEGAFYQPLVAHLDLGLALFFLVSGFVLYRPMLATRVLGSPGSSVWSYARRRFARIIPAYWIALTVAGVYPALHGIFTGNWWVYYGLLQNWPVYEATADCRAEPLKCGITPAWTLAIEMLFYTVLPLYALVLAKLAALLRGLVGWVAVELAVLAALALVSLPIQGLTWGFDPWLFYSPLGRAFWFAPGMALAVLSVRAQQRGTAPAVLRWAGDHPGALWTAAAAVYAGAAFFVLPTGPGLGFPLAGDRVDYVLAYAGAGLLSVLIVAPAVLGDGVRGWPRRLLGHPLLGWLGARSYGIYLWHFPVLFVLYGWGAMGWGPQWLAYPLVSAMTIAMTVAVAAASYRWVERPLMRWAARPKRPLVLPPRGVPVLPLPDGPGVPLAPAAVLAGPQALTLDSAPDGDGAPDAAGGMAGGLPGHP